MKAKDKSDGKGCIGCAVDMVKTCKGCIHRDDLLAKLKVTIPLIDSKK